nr:MAG TPA: hypothetical protein [Bacteriophage sp.]
MQKYIKNGCFQTNIRHYRHCRVSYPSKLYLLHTSK